MLTSEGFRDPYSLFSDLGQRFKPLDRVLPSDNCTENMIMHDGSRFDIEITPYMKEPMDAIMSRDYHTLVFAGCARSGKSISLVSGGVAHIIMSAPSDCLVTQATEAMARRYSRMVVGRMLQNTPKLKAQLTSNKDDNNVLSKFFRTGMVMNISSPTPSALSMTDYKFVFISDHDRQPVGGNSEGSVYSQASKRTQTFGSGGMTIVESSAGRDLFDIEWDKKSNIGIHQAPPVTGVLGLYNQGDRRILHWTCPHCNGEIKLKPGYELFCLPLDEELVEEVSTSTVEQVASKYASIWCPECGSEIEQKYKRKMNLEGYWKKENPDHKSKIASWWLGGIPAAFQTWESLIEKYIHALIHYYDTGDDERIKATLNTDMCLPFSPASIRSKVTADQLENRAEDYGRRLIPDGVRFLIASVDVQKFKFVVSVIGHGVNDEKWLIDRFDITSSKREDNRGSYLMVEPASYAEDWMDVLLPEVVQKRYDLEGDKERDMGIFRVAIDSGGLDGVTLNAYTFWKDLRKINLEYRKKVYLVKGTRPSVTSNTPMIRKVILDKSSSSARKIGMVGEQELHLLNTTELKDAVVADLARDVPGANYYHFPDWFKSHIYSEIVAEVRDDKGWSNPLSKRNEQFDLMVYDKAAVLIVLQEFWQKKINWDSPPSWCAEWDHNDAIDYKDGFARSNDTTKRKIKPRTRMRMK